MKERKEERKEGKEEEGKEKRRNLEQLCSVSKIYKQITTQAVGRFNQRGWVLSRFRNQPVFSLRLPLITCFYETSRIIHLLLLRPTL